MLSFLRRGRQRRKVFVIGRNKTGTTSMEWLLKELGFRVGNQHRAELLLEDWGRRDFRRIVRYCRSAEAFQDTPFSLDFTHQALDSAYPGSRFILTVRANTDEWFDSLVRFQTRMIGKGRVPTADDLKSCPYRWTGWMWRTHQLIYGADERTLYDRARYTRHYETYNERARHYFRQRPGDLLELDLAEPGALEKVGAFLQVDVAGLELPHLNRTSGGGGAGGERPGEGEGKPPLAAPKSPLTPPLSPEGRG